MRALLNLPGVTADDGASAYEIDIQAAIAASDWLRTPCKIVVRVFNTEASGTKLASLIAPDLVEPVAADNDFDTADCALGQGVFLSLPIDFIDTTTPNPLLRGAVAAVCNVTAWALTGGGA